MKYIQVPEDRSVIMPNPCPICRLSVGNDNVKTDIVSFGRYLEEILLRDPAMGNGYDAWTAIHDLRESFKDAPFDTCKEIDEAHWKLLNEIIMNPKGSLPDGGIMYQLIPFMDTILQATDKKPSQSTDKKPPKAKA